MNNMSLQKIILTLGVLLASAAFAQDKNADRKISGAEVLATGASNSNDVCQCNTVGGTLLDHPGDKNYDYLLNPDNPKAAAAPVKGQDGVE